MYIWEYIYILIITFGLTACGSVSEDSFNQNNNQPIQSEKPKDSDTNAKKQPATPDEVNTSTQLTKIQKALILGESSDVTQEDLFDATLAEIERLKHYLEDAKAKIFNLNPDFTAKSDGSSLTAIDWDPSHDASLFTTTLGKNIPLLITNGVEKEGYTIYNKTIGAIGEKGAGRYLVFGGNPFRTVGNAQMEQMLENSFSWLSGREDLKKKPFSIVLAHMDDSYWFKDESKTREWLDKHYGDTISYNEADSCDGDKLQGCLDKKPDLLIISQISKQEDNLTAISKTLNHALENNTSIIYIHHDGDLKPLGKELFSHVFDINYIWDNYWKVLTLDSFDPTTLSMPKSLEELESIKKLFLHLQAEDYAIDWSQCKDGKCTEALDLKEEFLDGAKLVRGMLNKLDKDKKRIFDENSSYTLQKLLALTGDKLRQEVTYPMDKLSTDDNTFLKSLYADYALYNFRDINPAQKDMGNFSRSDFSHITPFSKRLQIKSKKYFKAAGLYALPGKSITIRRNDESDVKVKVFINSLRAAATHEYEKNGYKRPKFLQTPHFEIKPHESITITSAYGGPIQLEFNKNEEDIDIQFDNVAQHPFWASEADSASFAKQLEDADFDWAEIVTDGFEIHSRLDKLQTSLANKKWEDVEDFVMATKQYISNYPHVLAGFKGSGIDEVEEITSFATEHNITIEEINFVKHMNADQATCGYGCSGNPYDAYWSFDPTFHGDLHELGHGLESGRFLFEGFNYHATTNPYSYYSKSKYKKERDADPVCQNLPFKELYEGIQQSLDSNDSAESLRLFWENSKWSHQVLVTIEAMMHTQKMGKLENGWHLLARLHLLDREAKRAKTDWENRKSYLGFSNYTIDEFNAMRKNDWLLISFSFAAHLDFRDYFDMLGITFSEKAAEQVADFEYEKVPKKLFVSTPNGYCKSDEYGSFLDKTLIDMKSGVSFPY